MKVKSGGLLVFLGVRIFVGFLAYLPRTAAYFLCRSLASIIYYVDSRHRQIGLTNLRIAFPDRSEGWRKRILKESFQSQGIHLVEICRLSREAPKDLTRRIRYETSADQDHYLKAKASGQGVLFVTAHVSAWELLPLAHALMSKPLNIVVRPLDNRYLDQWITKLRIRFGNQVIPKNNSLRMILRLLAKGEDVGLLIDQNVQEKDGVFVPFFGHCACSASGPAALALRTGVPVIAGFLLPAEKAGYFRIRFYPPLDLIRSGNYETDLAANTALFAQYVEEIVRQNPSTWLWGHRRFQTQPDGENIYA